MVDYFAIALTHALLALAAWRLVQRVDLDRDPAVDCGEQADDGSAPGSAPVSGPDPRSDARA